METQASICRELGVDPPLAAYYGKTGILPRFTAETAEVWRNRLRMIVAGKRKGLTVQEMREAFGSLGGGIGMVGTNDVKIAQRFGVEPELVRKIVSASRADEVSIRADALGLPENSTAQEIQTYVYSRLAPGGKAVSRSRHEAELAAFDARQRVLTGARGRREPLTGAHAYLGDLLHTADSRGVALGTLIDGDAQARAEFVKAELPSEHPQLLFSELATLRAKQLMLAERIPEHVAVGRVFAADPTLYERHCLETRRDSDEWRRAEAILEGRNGQ